MNKIWVIKIGSSLLTNNGTNINLQLIQSLAEKINIFHNNNIKIILVSSGAIASGMSSLNITDKPIDIHQLQSLASIGQMKLMHIYQQKFNIFNLQAAQILLTNDNLINKKYYDNIYSTINNLLNWSVVPIINENDTIATDEIKFGDNDNLSALVANLIAADKLIILTDKDGLFDDNPVTNKNAKLISNIKKNDTRLTSFASSISDSRVGTGGMLSKVLASKVAKCVVHIINGNNINNLSKILTEESVGTIIH